MTMKSERQGSLPGSCGRLTPDRLFDRGDKLAGQGARKAVPWPTNSMEGSTRGRNRGYVVRIHGVTFLNLWHVEHQQALGTFADRYTSHFAQRGGVDNGCVVTVAVADAAVLAIRRERDP